MGSFTSAAERGTGAGSLHGTRPDTRAEPSRRWLIGAEPFFEGGWFHKGTRARSWDVEDVLGAVAMLGDVTVDLTNPGSLPSTVGVHAYAIGRDVDVLVRPGTAWS